VSAIEEDSPAGTDSDDDGDADGDEESDTIGSEGDEVAVETGSDGLDGASDGVASGVGVGVSSTEVESREADSDDEPDPLGGSEAANEGQHRPQNATNDEKATKVHRVTTTPVESPRARAHRPQTRRGPPAGPGRRHGGSRRRR
jgi:hypothetical protein